MNVNNVHVFILPLHFDSKAISNVRIEPIGQNYVIRLTYFLFFVIVQRSLCTCLLDRNNIWIENDFIFLLYVLIHDL